MSTADSPLVMSVIVKLRQFQVLVMEDRPGWWFATISERTHGLGSTQALGSLETQEGAAAALHLALDHILAVGGIEHPTAVTGGTSAKNG